jgi:tetratricopeptide (TPR) repeat protein
MGNRSLSALVIDGSMPVRTSLRGILQGFDMTDIDVAASVAEGRRKIGNRKYDVILCEYHFDGDETGQDLLEQITDGRMQPPPTIFIMVTTEANYPRVMSVAEVTPDEYVLKPIQTGQLSDRLEKAFTRRDALMELHELLYAERYNAALKTAQDMMTARSRYASDVAKIIAHTLCRLERYREAAVFYRHVVKTKQLPWAKFGLAKVSLLQGDRATAEAMLVDVINQHLRYMPVYDYLADFYLAENRHAEALDITERALEVSPHSVHRLQTAGQLAFGLGQAERALGHLEKAVSLRSTTAEMSIRTLFVLASLRYGAGDSTAGGSMVKQLRAKVADFDNLPDQYGMNERQAERYADLGSALEVMFNQPLAAIDLMRALAGQWGQLDFDFAVAQDYLAVVARLYTEDLGPTLSDWVRPIALRYITSDAARDLFMNRVGGCTQLVGVVKEEAQEVESILALAEKLNHEGKARQAADSLIVDGQRSLNNRVLLAAAEAVAKLDPAESDIALREQADACLKLMNPPVDNATYLGLTSAMASPLQPPDGK